MAETATRRDGRSQTKSDRGNGSAEKRADQRSRSGDSAPAAGGHDETDPQVAAPLDHLLTEAGSSTAERFVPGIEAVKLVAALARRPSVVMRRYYELTAELAKVLVGQSDVGPPKGDRRFADDAWTGNPFFHRLLQSYLATGETLQDLIEDAELDWGDDRKLSFIVGNIVDALAPSNSPWLNPEVLKGTIDSGGLNFVRGTRNMLRDLRRPPRVPTNVDADKFELGENIARSPGGVVARGEPYELIQYEPTTDEVRETPLLIVPPMINKYYIVDLAPDRSVVEHSVAQGQQVFAISWRNPGEKHSDWDMDTYAQAVLDALDAVREICATEQAHVIGLCAGGLVSAATAAHLAHIGELDRIASLSLGVAVIDNKRSNVIQAFETPEVDNAATALSARQGYLAGSDLASVFLWLRPNDLIWPLVVNNWLLGKDPPAFDILYWNSDSTRLPAALHRQFIAIAGANALTEPGAVELLGSPVDLSTVTVDSYVMAGDSDHISPWQNAYQTTQLLGGDTRFVLSTSGHIAAIVNPPGNKKASYRTAGSSAPPDPEDWEREAETHEGTWWADWDEWLARRSGETRPAPKKLGSRSHKLLGPAPGEYVHQA